jgi:drug/metabolite transporter (DMT)-like permease
MVPVALAFASSVIWGLADFGGGLLARRHALLAVLLLSQVSALAVALGLVALAPSGRPGAAAIAWGVAAGVVGACALAAFYRGLAIGTMSIVAPVSATGAVVPVLVGLADGERPQVVQVAGIALALVGIVLAAREPGGTGPRQHARAALAFALVAAVGFGTFFVAVDEATSRAGVPWVLVSVRLGETALLGAAVLLARPRLPRARGALGRIAALGILDVGANALYALATTRGLLSVVAVVGSLYPAVTVVLARTVLRERVTRAQELGVLATLAGVVAISAG